MVKPLNLFSNDGIKLKSVSRFYHIDFYYFLLFALKNSPKNYNEVFNFVSKNKDSLVVIANTLESKEKFNSEYLIVSTIKECIAFDLVNVNEDEYFSISPKGNEVLQHVIKRNFESSEKEICEKVESSFGRLSQLISKCYEINPSRNGLIVFPKPSPLTLGYKAKELLNLESLKNFCAEFSSYSYNEILKHVNFEINVAEFRKILFNKLVEYINHCEEKGVSLNFTRETKKIAYTYYLDIFFEGKFDKTTFDIWIRRAREFRLLNFSEFFPGVNSLILYPVSVILPREPEKLPSSLKFMTKTRAKSGFIARYKPKWDINFKESFLVSLWDNYNELRKLNNNFFISVQDLRDIVCFKLQISEFSFADYLAKAYTESMNGTIPQFKISLEVDRSPEERKFINSKRYPILINQIPKNIIGIKMR